jgi:hypothetical protein
MPEMGRCRFYRRVCADEAVRGESYSRRHPQACVQNTPDEARDIRVIHLRRDAFCVGLAPRAKAGLVLVVLAVAARLAHVEAAIYVQDVSGDV